MSTSSRHFAAGLAMVVLNLTGLACSSSTPLRKTSDAAAGRDVGAEDLAARDAAPDTVGPDLAQVFADVPPMSSDAPIADLPAGEDVLLADLPVGKDTVSADTPTVKDAIPADLRTIPTDAPVVDVRAADAPLPADLISRDAPSDGASACKFDAPNGCNDDPASAAVMGTCQPDGTCACRSFYVLNPSTGRCMMPPRDASPSLDSGPTAAACTGDYTACGCGCCGGAASPPTCYYPSLGETVAAITAQDLATKNATNCALAGCSMGLHYVCCAETAPESPSSATYTANGFVGGLDHVAISKSGSDCATLSFARPLTSANTLLKLTMPPSWGVASAGFGTCGDAGILDQAQGAVGTLALRASGSQCLADLHATLFAFATDGTVKTSRLDADGVAVTGFPVNLCQ